MRKEGLVIYDDHHGPVETGCAALRFEDFTLSMTNYPRMPEIMVFAATGEDSPAFTLTEAGLRKALAWIDARRAEK